MKGVETSPNSELDCGIRIRNLGQKMEGMKELSLVGDNFPRNSTDLMTTAKFRV